MDTKKLLKHVPWALLGILGAFCLAVVALRRGEHVSALWIVVASVSVYLVAYRYYSLYIAQKVMKLDPTRATPAVINNDGLNYVPTNRYVLFGHHFAAIAGAGPLVGPVLAAQMGYLPGTLWLLAGVVLAGAVQDFMVLFISSRRNGASLGEMVKEEMGRVPGTIALFGCFLIMIIILAVLALIVVKALAESPWGVFTVCSTVPIALFMGIYMRSASGTRGRSVGDWYRAAGGLHLLRRRDCARPVLGPGADLQGHHHYLRADWLCVYLSAAAGLADSGPA